jgi:hypothetical protein
MKLLTVLLFGLVALWGAPQDKWAAADSAAFRLPPAAFTQLPKNIVRYLRGRGCTIPQTYLSREPHNVISGEFTRPGQTDWAVLCSRNGESSILVFWRGSVKSVSEVAKAPDRGYLQTVGEGGKIAFSRAIEPVSRAYILRHYKEYSGRRPPRITHQGIDDAYVEKASVVLYYHRGKWLELQGAD